MKTSEVTHANTACTHEIEAGIDHCRQCAWEEKPRTREEIENLKRNWASDPIWDIEHTEGFDAHTAELIEFGDTMKAYWNKRNADKEARRQQLLQEYAEELGTPGNTHLAYVIGGLVDKLDTLERANDELIVRVNHLSGRLDRMQ